ncbi:MAG TPA: VOC family protein [Kofleriaceae bacterium]|jgi:predicted enzyme related to lactoylglutathione lyase
MITKHSHTCVYVTDHERAKAFYTEKLGLEVRDDVRMGDFRWLTVAPKTQPDACIVLMLIAPGPMLSQEQVGQLRSLIEAGALSGGVLETDDCRRDYEELKANGVQFLREPKEMPYGVEALMRDDSGNFFSLTQRR